MRNPSEDKIKIVLIRHGATATNRDKRYCGKRSDEDLSEEGIKVLNEMKEKNAYPSASFLFVSPKKRAKSTAKIIYPELEQNIIEEFDEIDFGDFEGKNYEDLKDDPEYQSWIDSNGENAFPHGESKNEYCKRAAGGFLKAMDIFSKRADENADDLTKDPRRFADIAIVAHGGTIMALLSTFAGMNYYNCMVSNAKGYIVEIAPGYPDSMKVTGIIE